MTDRIISTNLDSQDDVQGYLTKQDARVVASVYFITANYLNALGDAKGAAFYEGYGYGLVNGAS